MLGVIDKRISEAQDPVTLSGTGTGLCGGAFWGYLENLVTFFSLISAANQSGGATRVALFYVPSRHQRIASKLTPRVKFNQ